MIPKVLAIDDSGQIHQLLDVRLKSERLSVYHALSAVEGMQKAIAIQPDLILLDVDMPYVSGFALCRQLKADPRTSLIPVIFLTGVVDVATKVQGFDLGGVDYVTKPFDADELRARVRAALRTKRYQDMLAASAQVDGLTGLRNRAFFDQRLKEELNASCRYGRQVSLIIMDIDHFKNINDSFGHPVGDVVLQTVGELISECTRTVDAACRYGGEEFGVILTETPHEGAITVAERIRVKLAEASFQPRGQPLQVTASLGVASALAIPAAIRTASMLVSLADEALYTAKRSGRNRVCSAAASPAARPSWRPAPAAVDDRAAVLVLPTF